MGVSLVGMGYGPSGASIEFRKSMVLKSGSATAEDPNTINVL